MKSLGEEKQGKRRSRTFGTGLELFGTAQTRKGKKQEETRRRMNSYSTHNDVTSLEFCCCSRKNKKKRRKQRARDRGSLIARLGIAEPALNEPRNLTSTSPQPQRHLKNNIKNHNKK
jgi:hypothetical protein